jgi:hypothetical protein
MGRGNRVDYVIDRLLRAGRADLADAVTAGRLSAYSVSVALGWVTRRATVGASRSNQAKRRRYALAREGLADAD